MKTSTAGIRPATISRMPTASATDQYGSGCRNRQPVSHHGTRTAPTPPVTTNQAALVITAADLRTTIHPLGPPGRCRQRVTFRRGGRSRTPSRAPHDGMDPATASTQLPHISIRRAFESQNGWRAKFTMPILVVVTVFAVGVGFFGLWRFFGDAVPVASTPSARSTSEPASETSSPPATPSAGVPLDVALSRARAVVPELGSAPDEVVSQIAGSM